jgi:hypothetical protein
MRNLFEPAIHIYSPPGASLARRLLRDFLAPRTGWASRVSTDSGTTWLSISVGRRCLQRDQQDGPRSE